MPKLIVLFLLSLFLSGISFAQSVTRISGNITDTIEKKNLFNSSILLLRKTDSILVRHARTDKSGNFLLKDIPPGHYLLMATYPSYADYVDELEVKDSAALHLPTIPMVLKSKLLEAVVVSNKGAIHIKGDTTEFNADSFHTQAGATVEDLLKRLPGIQVDKNGKITAQGETVQKVLVDGEEFFGDDPTLVTQNLRADMVDKVQVFDKKSDQSNFTGIDDGQKTKTINLKLKDSKKNGYFGRLTAGGGTDGYYDLQLMANYFRKKEKMAVYGIAGNTGKTGLNWQERDNYGQSFAGNIDVDDATGNLSFSGPPRDDLDSWSGSFEGQGFPTVKTGGLHYNNKTEDELQTYNGNYKFMQLNVNGNSSTNSQYILPDTFYYNNQRQTFHNQITRHNFNGSYEVKFDSTSSLKVQADGGSDHKITDNEFHSEALASDSSKVNQNDRTVTDVGNSSTVNSNLLWRKKLPKKGRTLSFNLRENYTRTSSSGYLNSTTEYFSGGLPSYDSVIDQFKNYHTENILFDSRLTYTEPITKSSFLIANYGVVVNNSHSDRSSFNKSLGGKYSSLDSLYSNDYQYNVFTQRGGLGYTLIKKKLRFSIGSDVGFTDFDQRDLHADTAAKRRFTNWYPQSNMTYSFSNQRRLSFYYNGYTTQPTLTQLQPILTNEDPLNITIGNPGLKPQFGNRFGLYFNDYKVFSERSIWFGLNYTFTQNAISNSVNVDATGKRVSQFVNVDGNYSLNANMNYGLKWKKVDMWVGLNGNINQSNNVSIVNNLPNTTHSGNYTFGFNMYKSKDKKYNFGIRPSATYTQSRSTINNGVTTRYWTYNLNPEMDIYLPFHFQVHGDADINLRQKTSVFENNNNVVLLNAWIGRKFLKNDALLLKASGNDLLNQNTGFNRTVNSNFISQNTYTTIKRYFMLSVVWNFTKAGTAMPGRN